MTMKINYILHFTQYIKITNMYKIKCTLKLYKNYAVLKQIELLFSNKCIDYS